MTYPEASTKYARPTASMKAARIPFHRPSHHSESTGFEDAIRNAISLGGDSDTLAAITGSIAEAAYGIPEWIKDKALSYLDEPMRDVYRRWQAFANTSK